MTGHNLSVKAMHVLISGRVQGVGYRNWTVRQAETRMLTGWVRNLESGQVEAFFQGDSLAVDDMIRACSTGPRFASVSDVVSTPAEMSLDNIGFMVL